MANLRTVKQTAPPPLYRLLAAESEGANILSEATDNAAAAGEVLTRKVLFGRAQQKELSARIRQLRSHDRPATTLSGLIEERRLYHIATILARAELLARGAPSLSRYTGDEAKFDDMTILERAKGFIELETLAEDAAEEAADAFREKFDAAESVVEKADY